MEFKQYCKKKKQILKKVFNLEINKLNKNEINILRNFIDEIKIYNFLFNDLYFDVHNVDWMLENYENLTIYEKFEIEMLKIMDI